MQLSEVDAEVSRTRFSSIFRIFSLGCLFVRAHLSLRKQSITMVFPIRRTCTHTRDTITIVA